MRRFFIIALALLAVTAHATIYTCASASRTDVAAKLDSAINIALVSGDTVNIPVSGGSVTWTTPINVTKGVTIQGAGSSLTTISCTQVTNSQPNGLSIILASNVAVRVTGIGWTGQVASELISPYGNVGGSGAPLTSLRIDNCTFTNCNRAISTHGYVYGCIDHNTFTNNIIAIGTFGDGTPAWTRPIQPGSANALYIEDNSFVVNASGNANAAFQIQNEEGSRVVFRYNTVDTHLYTAADAFIFDSHGNSSGGGQCDPTTATAVAYPAQPLVEIYNNDILVHHTVLLMDTRGGVTICYTNTFRCSAGQTIGIVMALREEETNDTGLFSPLRTLAVGGYPAQQQITQNFFSGNTYQIGAGTPVALTGGNSSSSATVRPYESQVDNFVQLNRDFFIRAIQSGDTYFPYTAYTYPNPLQGGPTASTATINSAGTSLAVAWSASVTNGADLTGMKITVNGTDYAGTYASGSPGTTTNYTVSKIYQTAAGTNSYTNSGTGIVATTGGALVGSYSGLTLTNNSTQAIPVPTSPTATKTGQSTITVGWTDGSGGITSFIIYRSLTNGSFVQIGTAAAGATTYGDTSLAAGTQYYYVVASTAQGLTSSQTSSVNAITDAALAPNFPVLRNPAALGAGSN